MDALHGRAKRYMGQKKWCRPHPHGGEKRGKSASETDLAVTTKSSPGLANAKSSGSLKTVPPLRAVDSKQMSALL